MRVLFKATAHQPLDPKVKIEVNPIVEGYCIPIGQPVESLIRLRGEKRGADESKVVLQQDVLELTKPVVQSMIAKAEEKYSSYGLKLEAGEMFDLAK